VGSTTLRKFAAGAALAVLAVLPACAFPDNGTEVGTGQFNGISISGPDSDQCSWNQPDTTHLVIQCPVVQTLIGADVYVSFPNKDYVARVQLASGSPFGVAWSERASAGPLPAPSNRGVITGTQFADLTGGSVSSNNWFIGLECSDSTSEAVADATVTISLR
jgi:hypothetical protein